MRVLSLDFDGVVHPGPLCTARVDTPHFGWLSHLLRLLAAHPDVQVLVHSSWREVYLLSELRMILGDTLGARVVGAAPSGEDRFAAIQEWMRENAPDAELLILDDDRSAFPVDLPPNLLLCDPCKGLSEDSLRDEISRWLESTAPRRRT